MEKVFGDNRLAFLFVIEDESFEEKIKLYLDEEYYDYSVVTSVEGAERICHKEHPHILFLGGKELAMSAHIYLDVLKEGLDLEPHRVVLMVKESDTDAAHKLCKNEVFHDYIVIDPFYDKQVFNLAISRALSTFKKDANLESLYKIDNRLRKLHRTVKQNRQTNSNIHKETQAIQKKLSDKLSDELALMMAKVHAHRIESQDAKKLKKTIDSFAESFLQTLEQGGETLDKVFDSWETTSNDAFNELSAALDISIKDTGVNRTILVVEDDSFYSKILTGVLKTGNYHVKVASTGKSGLERLNLSKVDLVILDWNLPDINGAEVLKTMKSSIRNSYIPVVVLTGDSQPEVVKQAISLGAANFIVKPSNKEQILGKIESSLSVQNY